MMMTASLALVRPLRFLSCAARPVSMLPAWMPVLSPISPSLSAPVKAACPPLSALLACTPLDALVRAQLEHPAAGGAPLWREWDRAPEELRLDNLIKKRRRKMNKHKHRKQLKQQRFLRRKLGK